MCIIITTAAAAAGHGNVILILSYLTHVPGPNKYRQGICVLIGFQSVPGGLDQLAEVFSTLRHEREEGKRNTYMYMYIHMHVHVNITN